MSDASSSSSGLLSTPPSGVDFLHRLRTDPKSHHICIGAVPVMVQPKTGLPSPASTPLRRSSSSRAQTPDPTIEIAGLVDSEYPVSEVETLRDLPPLPIDCDNAGAQAPLFKTGQGNFPSVRSFSDAGISSPHPSISTPISPKTQCVPLAKLRSQSPTKERAFPRRPAAASKRSQSDFCGTPDSSSEVHATDHEDRQRRPTEIAPLPHQPSSLSSNSSDEIDWQEFCMAYAAGMWNPLHPPRPPHGSTGKYSTNIGGHAPEVALPGGLHSRSPTSSQSPAVPLDLQWTILQQQNAGIGSVTIAHGVQADSTVANPPDVVLSAPNPEHEYADPFDPPQEPPRKCSEGLPTKVPTLPFISNQAQTSRESLMRKVDVDALDDPFGSMTLSQRENSHIAIVAETEVIESEQQSTSQRPLPAGDPLDAYGSMPQYASFIEAFPQIKYPTEMAVFYQRFGFLPAPMGPKELERRKALYSFNILHTAKDLNFDRVTHICKLMFNPKMVVLSLIDSDTSWYKSATGLDLSQSARVTSFCSHTILGNTDEPMVVLDAKKDWRFARNPHVVAAPNISFFAGAPLMTSDGHCLGALCLIDDKPWKEFSPRSRLLLKELAMVVMREMELWRDKLQLRTRGKIQVSMENFARDCLTIDEKLNASALTAATRMAEVYSRAARLIRKTLDLDGCSILDISQFERLQSTDALGEQHTLYHANPFSGSRTAGYEMSECFGTVNAFPVLASTGPEQPVTRPLTSEEHERMSKFLEENRDGRIYENVVPTWIRYIFPSSLEYGIVVPLLDMDQQPFAMICAHTHDKGKQFLEGYELQFLRAIGVIILSAVLQRRMALANRSKSVLISSVSHELRTPLHGILAAAELLTDTKLDSNQEAFLSTVRTCGLQLIDTVNHVLDFTKLSADSKNGTDVRRQIQKQTVDLAELLHSTVESCWLGQRARLMQIGETDSDLGSYYAPAPMGLVPKEQRRHIRNSFANVETVIDVCHRQGGWNVVCEPGGIRRIIMNLYGNSVKFTKEGYVQVALRELPHPPEAQRIPVELSVIDTGKGISKSFLKDQLFQPFSQENPLQAGTGLGLAIVNTIVRSEGMDGSLEVVSAEGVGTEIKVTFEVDLLNPNEEAETMAPLINPLDSDVGRGFSVAFVGFSPDHRGHKLLTEVMTRSSSSLGFDIASDTLQADVIIANETYGLLPEVVDLLHSRALIVLSSIKGQDNEAIRRLAATEGHVGLWHKPLSPSMFTKEMKEAAAWLRGGRIQRASSCALSSTSTTPSLVDDSPTDTTRSSFALQKNDRQAPRNPAHRMGDPKIQPTLEHLNLSRFKKQGTLARRHSDEHASDTQPRPVLGPRGVTFDGQLSRAADETSAGLTGDASLPAKTNSPSSAVAAPSTIPLGDGGAMLETITMKPAVAALRVQSRPRVMVVEDNAINRRVLTAFLRKKGFSHAEAIDGLKGVELFRDTPPSHWDVILMDINMPVMDGLDATRAIRSIEASRRHRNKVTGVAGRDELSNGRLMGNEYSGKHGDVAGYTASPHRPPESCRSHDPTHVKIFALTGLATSDDKRTAFNAGVDGYLVKPVSLSSLDVLFKKIGFEGCPSK